VEAQLDAGVERGEDVGRRSSPVSAISAVSPFAAGTP
jgi:hypothetical protein